MSLCIVACGCCMAGLEDAVARLKFGLGARASTFASSRHLTDISVALPLTSTVKCLLALWRTQ